MTKYGDRVAAGLKAERVAKIEQQSAEAGRRLMKNQNMDKLISEVQILLREIPGLVAAYETEYKNHLYIGQGTKILFWGYMSRKLFDVHVSLNGFHIFETSARDSDAGWNYASSEPEALMREVSDQLPRLLADRFAGTSGGSQYDLLGKVRYI